MNQRNVTELFEAVMRAAVKCDAREIDDTFARLLAEEGVIIPSALTESDLERIWNAGWFNDAMGFPDQMREEMVRVAKGEPPGHPAW